MRAVVGALNKKYDGTSIKLDRIHIHPQYDTKYTQHDIAVLKTLNQIIFSKFVKPITLPFEQPKDKSRAYVSGFGEMQVCNGALKIYEKSFFSVFCVFFFIPVSIKFKWTRYTKDLTV